MRSTSLLTVIALAGIATAACSDAHNTSPLAPPSGRADFTATAGTSLFFNGINANASTNNGTIATNQIDNMVMSATVRYDGPNAANGHQTIVYNGHGAVSGWGVLVLGPSDGATDGTIAILAGGITVAPTSLVLPLGQWVEVAAERTNGVVKVRMGAQSQVLGYIPVNPVGTNRASIERTSVGGDGLSTAPTGVFHGAMMNNVTIRTGQSWLERWAFNGVGSSITGANGAVLNLGNATWF